MTNKMTKNKIVKIVKKMSKIFLQMFLIHLKSALEYRKSFFIQIFGMMINNASFLLFWMILFQKFSVAFSEINISFTQIVLLWALASSGFGFMHIFFYGARYLSDQIINGKLDIYLVYPVPVMYMSLLAKSSSSAWGDLFYGYILWILFLPKTFGSFLLFTYFTMLSGIVLASFLIIINTLTFFWGNAEEVSETMFGAMLAFGTYPEDIFSGFIKIIFFTLIPVGFSIYLPVRILLNFNLSLFLFSSGAAATLGCIAVILFNAGLKRYESGNLFYSNK